MRIALIAVGSVVVLIVVVGILGNATGLLKTYRIPTPAMAPALDVGDRVLVRKSSSVARGDIAFFHPPTGAIGARCGAPTRPTQPCRLPTGEDESVTFVKRVIAMPGEEVSIRNNRAYIDGEPLDEPYVNEDTPCEALCNMPDPIEVPEGHYFMLGDNRGASDDSRFWGPVPLDWIQGRVETE